MEMFTTRGVAFQIDEEDFHWVSQHNWILERKGYVVLSTKPHTKLHRMVMGVVDAGRRVMIDHVSLDRLDNRKSNLRLADASTNNQNRTLQRNNTSGHKGIVWNKQDQAWRARIGLNGVRHYVGQFKKLEDAVEAAKRKRLELHGTYARDF